MKRWWNSLANVISSDKIGKHSINKYTFKVLSANLEESEDEFAESVFEKISTKEEHPERRESDIDASAMSSSSKDSLIESLLKKTDDMSSNFIKLQMKLESMSDEHKIELAKVKDESFKEGVESGKALATKNADSNMSDAVAQFSNSISTLEKSAKEFESALEEIKKDLMVAALDIAKEVVSIELSENSNEVAATLSKELIKELQSASKVTLKVNPKDHGTVSEKVGSLKHVEIVSDRAVSQGGVIAISDAGNIDAEISKRFERVKRAALNG